jgi:ATP-dependent DNA ligase
MRRKPTEEQKQAAAHRREKMREICRQIKAMDDGERERLASRLQAVNIDCASYSLYNQCMIAFQKPDATVLSGFRQWKAHGRTVRKGEHGIGIWVPRFAGKTETETGEKVEGEVEGFLFGTVFDITQTEEMQAAAL